MKSSAAAVAVCAILTSACGQSASTDATPGPSDGGTKPGEECTSDRMYTRDVLCPSSGREVGTMVSYLPTSSSKGAHVVPWAFLSLLTTSRPEVSSDSCSPVLTADSPCGACSDGQYCHSDGQCRESPEFPEKDQGAIELTVGGAAVGELLYAGSYPHGSYEAQGDLGTRLDPLWLPGEVVGARNDSGLPFEVSAPAPAFMAVTSFEFSPYATKAVKGQPLGVTWEAGDGQRHVELSFGTYFAYAICVAKDDGDFSLPWELIEAIGKEAPGELHVFARRTVRKRVVAGDKGFVDLVVAADASQGYAYDSQTPL